MKRLFKKNQIIIATLAVMIAIAGYLNYSGILFGESEDSTTEANADLANQELLDISEEDIESSTEDIESNDSDVEGTPGEAVLTSGTAETTVAQAKVTREQVRAENKETLQGIIDNTNLSDACADDRNRRTGGGDRDTDGVKRILRISCKPGCRFGRCRSES